MDHLINTDVSRLNRPYYLANVLSIAKVDGKVPAGESLALRAIVKRIGANDQDLADAARLLGSGSYRVQLPDVPSERMANIQDMVMVALADGDVSPDESAPIEKAVKRLGFSQVDIDMIVRRAEHELRKIAGTKTPAEEVPAALPPPVPPASVAPPPPPLPKAPARKAPKVVPPEPAPVPVEEEAVAPVPHTPEAETPEEQAEVRPPHDASSAVLSDRIQACMARRSASVDPAGYCFGRPDGDPNVWGCRLAGMDWVPGAAWFELGAFRDDETFVFDKQAIADRLDANLSDVVGCPHLHVAYTEKAFDELPKRASVRGHWQYREAKPGDPTAVTVRVMRYIHGCPLSTAEQVTGVDPDGPREAEKLIHRAMRASGRRE